jgi:hypothetical protein
MKKNLEFYAEINILNITQWQNAPQKSFEEEFLGFTKIYDILTFWDQRKILLFEYIIWPISRNHPSPLRERRFYLAFFYTKSWLKG